MAGRSNPLDPTSITAPHLSQLSPLPLQPLLLATEHHLPYTNQPEDITIIFFCDCVLITVLVKQSGGEKKMKKCKEKLLTYARLLADPPHPRHPVTWRQVSSSWPPLPPAADAAQPSTLPLPATGACLQNGMGRLYDGQQQACGASWRPTFGRVGMQETSGDARSTRPDALFVDEVHGHWLLGARVLRGEAHGVTLRTSL